MNQRVFHPSAGSDAPGARALPARRFLPAAMRHLSTTTLLLGAVLLAGCKSFSAADLTPTFGFVYKIDVQQGAVVTEEMVAQLKPGMSRDQVRFVLGTPPVTDPFHADRWDYIFTIQHRGGPIERRNYTVVFEDNRLKTFGGDKLPSEKEFDANEGKPGEPVVLPPRF